MSKWLPSINIELPSLVAAICLFFAFRYATVLSPYYRWLGNKRQDSPSTVVEYGPTLDGNDLHYRRTRWPQYDARFNLRLSYLHGPVVRVSLESKTLLVRLVQQFNRWLCPAWRPSRSTILINSLAEDESTLKKLINACASRTTSVAAGQYLSRGRRIVLQPYGPEWVRHRKEFALLLTKAKIENQWTKALRFEAMVLVDRVSMLIEAASPPDKNLVDEISRFTASSVLQITYALRAPTPEDPILKDLDIVSRNIGSAFTPGKYCVEDYPLLDVFPAIVSPWKRKLNADHKFESDLFGRLLQSVEDRLACSEARGAADDVISVEECGAAHLLRNQESHQLDRDHIAYLAAGLFEAGTETTAMTINTFILAAACYPEYVQRAQVEIDRLVLSKYGDWRAVPAFEDLEQLQILAALVKETLRLTPTGSSGVGHTPTAGKPLSFDIKSKHREFAGKLNVSGSETVLANIYGIHHDEKLFPDPWRFSPDRWLSSKPSEARTSAAQRGSSALDHTHATFAFGFGRRICPGSALASYSLSMAMALLLLCYDFELTGTAETLCAEMESQLCDEYNEWIDLFPTRGRGALEAERISRESFEDQRDRVGRILIDAHIAFKLSRGQLAQCVRLKARGDGSRLRVVQDTLASIRQQA